MKTSAKPILRILVTRPAAKSEQLANTLNALAGVGHVEVEPLFSYQEGSDLATLAERIARYQKAQHPKFIFVSQQAVTAAFNKLPLAHWPQQSDYIAVGKGTQKALEQIGIKEVLIPDREETSEGLLALPELTEVSNKKILIVRGESGRELLKTALTERGAQVEYAQVYKRVWHTFTKEQVASWQQLALNTAVITSKESLEHWAETLGSSAEYWQQTLLIVASERIANRAKALGFKRVIDAKGASDKAIVSALPN